MKSFPLYIRLVSLSFAVVLLPLLPGVVFENIATNSVGPSYLISVALLSLIAGYLFWTIETKVDALEIISMIFGVLVSAVSLLISGVFIEEVDGASILATLYVSPIYVVLYGLFFFAGGKLCSKFGHS